MAAPPRVAWSRPEPFGAWVRLDDATLIAVDHDLAARLGVAPRDDDEKASSRLPSRPLELHIAVTSRCFAPCEGCYMDARPDGEDPPLDQILDRLKAARDAGASTIALGGGEPLLRADLGVIAEAARSLGLVPVMTTSGIGLTEARARELVAFAQVNVSHDGALGAYRDVRGFDGQDAAERAIASLCGAGIPVGANVTLTRSTFDALPATAERVADLGALEIQLLRYKPGGRAAGSMYADRRLSPDQIDRLWPMIRGLVERRRLRVRIDCAMVPLLSSGLIELGPRAADVARSLAELGVFGCEAARHLAGMRVDGTLSPCSFFSVPAGRDPSAPRPRRALPLAEGSPSRKERAPDHEGAARELDVFRAYHASLPEPCRSCELASVCRGGCQVVSRYESGGALAPDPECPKVRSLLQCASEAPATVPAAP